MRNGAANPRWIEGMQQHGYKGAFEMGASLDYLFAYTPQQIVFPTGVAGHSAKAGSTIQQP